MKPFEQSQGVGRQNASEAVAANSNNRPTVDEVAPSSCAGDHLDVSAHHVTSP